MRARLLFIAIAAATLAGCAGRTPIVLPAAFVLPGGAAAEVPAGPSCRLRILTVADARDDKQFMGSLGGRPVRAADAAAWIRSGLESLYHGARMARPRENGADDVEIRAELLKGYVRSAASTKTAEIVLRVAFHSSGRPDMAQVYRGSREGTNWAATENETRSILNQALADALGQVQKDILTRCPT